MHTDVSNRCTTHTSAMSVVEWQVVRHWVRVAVSVSNSTTRHTAADRRIGSILPVERVEVAVEVEAGSVELVTVVLRVNDLPRADHKTIGMAARSRCGRLRTVPCQPVCTTGLA